MEAFLFFVALFGFLFLMTGAIYVTVSKSEKQKTNQLHDEFLKQFN